MKKCLRITFNAAIPKGFLQDFVLKNARKLDLEGTAQVVQQEEKVRVLVCGLKENVDEFLDTLHKGTPKVMLEDIEIEPFLKDRDYRGVFRVIE